MSKSSSARSVRGWLSAAIVAVTVAVFSATAVPADAHQWTDPAAWGGGHTIGRTVTVRRGNIVKLWQGMMHARYGGWAGQYSNGSPKIDGAFGATTENYTLLWQAEHQPISGIAVDGVVGPQTWNAARWFHLGGPIYVDANWREYRYSDHAWYVWFRYARPFATWLQVDCGISFYPHNPIDHPGIDPGMMASNCG